MLTRKIKKNLFSSNVQGSLAPPRIKDLKNGFQIPFYNFRSCTNTIDLAHFSKLASTVKSQNLLDVKELQKNIHKKAFQKAETKHTQKANRKKITF